MQVVVLLYELLTCAKDLQQQPLCPLAFSSAGPFGRKSANCFRPKQRQLCRLSPNGASRDNDNVFDEETMKRMARMMRRRRSRYICYSIWFEGAFFPSRPRLYNVIPYIFTDYCVKSCTPPFRVTFREQVSLAIAATTQQHMALR